MSDARNIALTSEATQAAARVQEALRLATVLDAVRVGLAYAIRNGLDPEREGGAPTGSNYNVATIDTPDAALRELVCVFYDSPEVLEAPYRAIEALMSRGLVLLRQHLEDGTVGGLADLVSSPEENASVDSD